MQSEMTFLDVFEGVEYESAIIPKLSVLMGGGRVCESSIGRDLPKNVRKVSRR